MSEKCRYCCKSRKLHQPEFLGKPLHAKQSTIRITSVALPKPPMSFASGDEVSRISKRKPRLRPSEIWTPSARRLLQLSALFRHAAMSDFGLLCAQDRTSIGRGQKGKLTTTAPATRIAPSGRCRDAQANGGGRDQQQAGHAHGDVDRRERGDDVRHHHRGDDHNRSSYRTLT